jgi:hypothetical protein
MRPSLSIQYLADAVIVASPYYRLTSGSPGLEIIAYQNEFCILRELKTAGLARLGG